MEDTGRHVVHQLERFLNTLGTIAGTGLGVVARKRVPSTSDTLYVDLGAGIGMLGASGLTDLAGWQFSEDRSERALVSLAGTTLGAGQIGVLAALGVARVSVHESPHVAVVANGGELVPLDRFEEVRAGRAVPESNTHAITAAVREIGGRATSLGIARDTEESVAAHLEAALASPADALLTLAGASMGLFCLGCAASTFCSQHREPARCSGRDTCWKHNI